MDEKRDKSPDLRPRSNARSGSHNNMMKPDIGDGSNSSNSLFVEPSRLDEASNASAAEPSQDYQRREENPFSFKHFLQSSGSNDNYQGKGARPKVFCSPKSPNVPEKEMENEELKIMPELSSALPDFVQDHLIMEQCYLGKNASHSNNDNLPDFMQKCRKNPEPRVKATSCPKIKKNKNTHISMPFDLPADNRFPLDLPLEAHPPSINSQTIGEVGNSKSLPDFLADSALCAQKSDNSSIVGSPLDPESRLRQELELTRTELREQINLNEGLRNELKSMKNRSEEYTKTLAVALRNAEDSLEKNKCRMAGAENTITKLKLEIKSLSGQLNHLRLENQQLRHGSGGHKVFNGVSNVQADQLAQDLRAAAGVAEHSLRQLLSGVDNLRIIANALENLNYSEEKKFSSQASDND